MDNRVGTCARSLMRDWQTVNSTFSMLHRHTSGRGFEGRWFTSAGKLCDVTLFLCICLGLQAPTLRSRNPPPPPSLQFDILHIPECSLFTTGSERTSKLGLVSSCVKIPEIVPIATFCNIRSSQSIRMLYYRGSMTPPEK